MQNQFDLEMFKTFVNGQIGTVMHSVLLQAVKELEHLYQENESLRRTVQIQASLIDKNCRESARIVKQAQSLLEQSKLDPTQHETKMNS